jgi:hypothetical protein
MSTISKILATVALIVGFVILNAALQAGSGSGGRSPGILGIIFLVGLIAALRAVWRKSKTDNIDKVDTTSLKKD